MALRRELHRRGLRFHTHPAQLPGRPDVVLSAARLAIFVDGCFWHACPDHGTRPKNNSEWWDAKLIRNVQRDREKDVALQSAGWSVVHVWEHADMSQAADSIEAEWRTRTGRSAKMPGSPIGV
jgi:DNA mismatch endonuclease (patch repair protein)